MKLYGKKFKGNTMGKIIWSKKLKGNIMARIMANILLLDSLYHDQTQ